MNTQQGMLKAFTRAVSDNSPAILSVIGTAGFITTAVLAVKAAPAAAKAIREAKIKKLDDVDLKDVEEGCLDSNPRYRLTPGELFLATWRPYLPAAMTAGASIFCIMAANRISINRNAAAIAAYSLVDRTLREYREEVIERIGEKDNDEVEERIIARKIEEGPTSSKEVFLVGGGETLCFEGLSGRYFQSDWETIRQAANDLNHRMLTSDMYFSLNEWFDALGLPPTDLGSDLGWSIENRLEVKLSSHIAGDGRPAAGIRYENLPRRGYSEL